MKLLNDDVAWRLVDGVIEFANWRTVPSTRKVETHFDKLAKLLAGRQATVRRLDPDNIDAFRDDQRWLRELLARLSSRKRDDKDALGHAVQSGLEQLNTQLVMDGDSLRFAMDVDSVRALCALAVALIVDSGAANQVRECALPDCGNFVVAQGSRRGKPRKFCSREHALEADKPAARERARRSRESHGAKVKRARQRKKN